MDYKSVIEEQIRELQKVQDSNVKNLDSSNTCKVATTIIELVILVRNLE